VAGTMEFGLLGPLMVRSGGTVVPVRRGHPRAVLAILLLGANRVVPVETIAEVLWGATPPRSAWVGIRSYIRWLRQAFGEAGQQRIITQPRGYLIRVTDGELDIDRFGHLLASAQAAGRSGSWPAAADQARQALSWWRGEPLADVESDTLALREAPRLAEMRLQATEIRIEADLRLGGHTEVAAEAQHLCAAHPLREHLHALSMLALYRCGRQAEALAAYQHVRSTLVSELGAEPGTELQTLHQQILRADSALTAPQPAAAATPPAGPRPGEVTTPGSAGGQAPVVPRQLPATVTCFTGRADELAVLARMLDQAGAGTPGTVVISAIGGTPGVGKTALAIHWAHQVAAQFADGQLYVNLRGFDPADAPVAPAEAIRGFLEALGVAPDRIPPSPDTQTGLYRSLLSGKQMLIVLDNARDEHQVRPLLPGSPGCVVVITSRSQLTGLAASNGARLITLDVLTPAEARQMLAARIGAAVAAAEPDAVSEMANLCGCLPLALAVAAARAAARPHLPLTVLAAELRDTASRLDALDTADPTASVRTVFSWSYQELSPAAARMFRLLGLHPGPDITAMAAASLGACSLASARRVLAELTGAHLVTERGHDRYLCHDLLRTYAADQARTTDSDSDREAATGRLLDYYLHTAHAAARVLSPSRDPLTLPPPQPGAAVEQPADHQQAMAWFAAEQDVLVATAALAAEQGSPHAWQIPWTMTAFLDRRGSWNEAVAILHTALGAATRLGDAAGQAVTRHRMAFACAKLTHYDEARAHLVACLQLCQQLGDQAGEARAYQTLGYVADRQGHHADALRHSEQALRVFQATGNTGLQAVSLNDIGCSHTQLGNYLQAQSFCQRALILWREVGDRWGEAHTWDSLGYVAHCLGQHADAVGCYQQALGLFRELKDRFNEAEILSHIGDTHHAAGQIHHARDAWHLALVIHDELDHPAASGVRAKLATADEHGPAEPLRRY
jgi:DNA-binding SARP family transcriptional activator/tetratricopeptide (TPR) repeat protein